MCEVPSSSRSVTNCLPGHWGKLLQVKFPGHCGFELAIVFTPLSKFCIYTWLEICYFGSRGVSATMVGPPFVFRNAHDRDLHMRILRLEVFALSEQLEYLENTDAQSGKEGKFSGYIWL